MNFKWLKFVSISMLCLYGAASTAVHSNAYDNLLKIYNSNRAAADYHEKVYEILGGAQGFSHKPITPAQLSNIVYITVHAALNSKEPDNLFLQKTLKENQNLINMPSLSEERKQDRIYHYGILMVIYAATKLSQQDDNLFTLPERVQDYLKVLAEDSILTGVFSQSLKDLLSRANKHGISQLLASYKFTKAYHSASLNAGGLMLDGAAVVDYSHGAGSGSGATTRASSSLNLSANPSPSPSPSTESTSSVPSSDVPADIAHLNEENRKKLKRMQLFTKTEGNEQARARQIDTLTRSQAAGVGGGVGPIGGLGGLLAGKANALNKTGGPSSTANVSATQPEIDLKSMFNLSAIKKIGKDLSIESADSKDEKIAKLQAYKEELTKISAGTDETEIKQAADYLKIVNFLIKELKKKTINPKIIDLLTKRGSTMGISVSVITEDSLLEEIQNLETQITKLRLDLAELEMSKVGLVEGDKKLEAIQRQIISKQNAIRAKNDAVRYKTKERGLLIGKMKKETASAIGAEDISQASVSLPVVEAGAAASSSLIPLEESEALLTVPVSPPMVVRPGVTPSPTILKPTIKKENPVILASPVPVLPKKPLKIQGTGSIFADLSMSHAGALNKTGGTISKVASANKRNLEELGLDKIKATEKIRTIMLQKEVIELEIQALEAKRDAEAIDAEKEKIEMKLISKNKQLDGKKTLIEMQETDLRKIEEEISKARILKLASAWRPDADDEDSSSDSDEDPDDWD